MYMCGLYGMNHHLIDSVFSPDSGPPVFRPTMSQQRMDFLLSSITFDDPKVFLLSDQFLSYSILTAPNMLYHHNFFHQMRHYFTWDIKLYNSVHLPNYNRGNKLSGQMR